MKKILMKINMVLMALIMVVMIAGCQSQGKSAYQIALDNGFVGTEKEWLDSLKGDNGLNGIDGKDGTSIDIDSLFEAYLTLHPTATFEEFLNNFLVVSNYDSEYAATKALLSVVRIRSRFLERVGSAMKPTYEEYYGEGSGVIYKMAGGIAYIITNYHVVYDKDSYTTNKLADLIVVGAYGMIKGVDAEFIGGSITKDIALIKTSSDDLPDFVTAATIADSNTVAPGQKTVAVGNPLAGGISVTAGVVSVDSEDLEMNALDSTTTVSNRVIRTDTPINPGNSGGGLFNSRGELIGIVNAKLVSEEIDNVGFAIPSNIATGIVNNILYNNAKKCVLGVTVTIASSKVSYDIVKNKIEIIETISVFEINPGSLAAEVLQKDDILISAYLNNLAEFKLTRLFYLSDYLYKARVGDILHLNIDRAGEQKTLDLQIQTANFVAV